MTLKLKTAIDSLNPRTGEKIGSFTPTSPTEIPELLQKARTAAQQWGARSLVSRKTVIKRAYLKFYENQAELALLISQETGKPITEAFSNEIFTVLDCFKYYLKNIDRFLKPQKLSAVNPLLKLRTGRVQYEPLGILAVISPWNYPLLLSMQHIVPALLCGNGIIFKPSEFTSLIGQKIAEVFKEASLPPDLLTVVTGLSDVGSALVNSEIDKIFFTGSTSVGKKIYSAASQNLTPVNMELGGSDAMVVFKDANLERAANAAVWGAFANAGQACVSIERIFVETSIKEQFVKKVIAKAKSLSFCKIGSNNGEVSCLINETQFSKIKSMVHDARNKGAEILFGGEAKPEIGDLFFEPTLITNLDSTMKISKEEIFGPLVTLDTFDTENEMLEKVNNSEFGLSASVWTNDIKKGRKLASEINAGSIIINDTHIILGQFEAPYIGYKNSGLGVSHGEWGIAEMVRPKYVNHDKPLISKLLKFLYKPLHENDVWWYKYNEERFNDFKAFTNFLHGSFKDRLAAALPALKALLRKNYL